MELALFATSSQLSRWIHGNFFLPAQVVLDMLVCVLWIALPCFQDTSCNTRTCPKNQILKTEAQCVVSCSYLCRLPAHKASWSVLLAFSLAWRRGGNHIFGERKQSLMLSDHHCHQLLDLRSRCKKKQIQMWKDYDHNVLSLGSYANSFFSFFSLLKFYFFLQFSYNINTK